MVIAWFIIKPGGHIAVGSKDFTEQVILGEILAQVIEAKTGQPVTRRFDLGGNLAHEALVAGEIDVYIEYTGTALLAILKARLPIPRRFTSGSKPTMPTGLRSNGLSRSVSTTPSRFWCAARTPKS